MKPEHPVDRTAHRATPVPVTPSPDTSSPDTPVTITVRENGPFFIAGSDLARVRLVDHQGNVVSTEGRKAISLCRCGASTKKPFCDGTHSKIGFRGAEAAQAAYDAGQAGAPTEAPAVGAPGGTAGGREA